MRHPNIITLMTLLLLCGCGALRQTPEEKLAQEQQTAREVQQMLDQQSYRIDVNYMIPLRGGSKAVHSYSITVDGGTIDSHLPYLGQARNVPYGGGKGLTFKEDIEKYSDTGLQGDKRIITLTVKNDEDTYIYTLTVFDNGQTDIHVNCRNRDDISYHGELRTDWSKDELQ